MLARNSIQRVTSGERLPFNFSNEQLVHLLTTGAEHEEKVTKSAQGREEGFPQLDIKLRTIQAQLSPAQRQELELFAINLVKQEFGINNELQFNAKIVTGLRPLTTVPSPPNLRDPFSEEQQKRRSVNALIHGAAGSFQYTFLLAKPELDQIHPELSRLAHSFMAEADMGLWQFNESKMNLSKLAPLGIFRLDFSSDPITIKAAATHFPLLVHELAKGVIEALSIHGLPSALKERQALLSTTDNTYFDGWDLRVGKGLWRLVNAELPRGKSERNTVLSALFCTPANEFNAIINALVDGNEAPLKELALRALA